MINKYVEHPNKDEPKVSDGVKKVESEQTRRKIHFSIDIPLSVDCLQKIDKMKEEYTNKHPSQKRFVSNTSGIRILDGESTLEEPII